MTKKKKYINQKSSYKEAMLCKEFCNIDFQSDIAIIIPVYNEYPDIFNTLDSLYDSFLYFCNENEDIKSEINFLIVINVNNKINSDQQIKSNNQILLEWFKKKENLQKYNRKNFKITVLDCTKENESEITVFPSSEGVGLARKIGMDFALLCGVQVLACMDADTLVDNNYLCELAKFFLENKNQIKLGLTYFKHQINLDNDIQKSILDYENWMHKHSECLQNTGTPFYPIALGPTIVCTTDAYIQAGGMNRKLAGEDFYFLQSLIKIIVQKNDYQVDSSIYVKLQTIVYPSSRLSDRTLFGTGKTLTKQQSIRSESCELCYKVFPDKYYDRLKFFIEIFNKNNCISFSLERFKQDVIDSLSIINDFLVKDDFWKKFDLMIKNCKKTNESRRIAFLCYFDGLKIIRLFHHFDTN